MALEKEALGFWERLMKFKDKHGYWNLTKLVLFVAFAVALLFLAKNFGESYSFERQKEAINEVMQENNQQMFLEHEEKMEQRRNIKPYVTEILKTTVTQMKCGRAFVIELHNGSNNTAGLPFIHCTMTYEEDGSDIQPIDEDYQNLSLSRFSFPEFLHTHDFWHGSIDEFEKIDPKVTSRMRNNDVTYLVIATLEIDDNEIGYFGFTYCNGKQHPSDKDIMSFVVESVQKLSKWLDKGVTE
jgi:hypothetical protein